MATRRCIEHRAWAALRRLGRGVFVVALFFLAITPQGFMLDVDENGVATFVICTPDGLVERRIPGILDHTRSATTEERASGLACPYALISDSPEAHYFGGLPPVAFARADAPGLPYLAPTLRRLRDRPGMRAPPAAFL